MLKTMLLVKRREGSTFDELSGHYQEVHAPLAGSALLTLRRYVRNFVDPSNSEDRDSMVPWIVDEHESTMGLA